MHHSSGRNVIGPQVRRLRYRRGWSQNKLAIKLQIAGMDYASRGKVCKIEARDIRVSDDDMLFLAHVLGVELKDLYLEVLNLDYFHCPAIQSVSTLGHSPHRFRQR